MIGLKVPYTLQLVLIVTRLKQIATIFHIRYLFSIPSRASVLGLI